MSFTQLYRSLSMCTPELERATLCLPSRRDCLKICALVSIFKQYHAPHLCMTTLPSYTSPHPKPLIPLGTSLLHGMYETLFCSVLHMASYPISISFFLDLFCFYYGRVDHVFVCFKCVCYWKLQLCCAVDPKSAQGVLETEKLCHSPDWPPVWLDLLCAT